MQVHPRGARGEGKPQLPPRSDVLLIATNLLDVPADVIALIYRYRWIIEPFFRFFKQILGCRHLISDDPHGITIQCCCAVIACMLLQLYSGKKPDKAMHGRSAFTSAAGPTKRTCWANKPDRTGVKIAQREAYFKSIGL